MSFKDLESNWLHKRQNQEKSADRMPFLTVDKEFVELTEKLRELETLTNAILASAKHDSNSGSRVKSGRESLEDLIAKANASAKATKILLKEYKYMKEREARTGANASSSKVYQFNKLTKDFERQYLQLEGAIQKAIAVRSSIQDKEQEVETDESAYAKVQQQRLLEEQLINSQIYYNHEDLRQREEEFKNLHKTAIEVNELFQDLAVMVDKQQEHIDHVDLNTRDAHQNTEQGLQELNKATARIKLVGRRTLIFFLLLLVAVIVTIIVLVKK